MVLMEFGDRRSHSRFIVGQENDEEVGKAAWKRLRSLERFAFSCF
jgi:hypothetical protein